MFLTHWSSWKNCQFTENLDCFQFVSSFKTLWKGNFLNCKLWNQGIIAFTGTETFANIVNKVIAGPKVDARAVLLKKSTVFFLVCLNLLCCVTTCEWVLFVYVVIYIIGLLSCVHWRLATELWCLCFTLEIASLFLVFFYYRLSLFAHVTTERSIQCLAQKTRVKP